MCEVSGVLKDINTSEKIIRIKCLVQEGFNMDDSVKVSEEDRRRSTKLVNDFEIDAERQYPTCA